MLSKIKSAASLAAETRSTSFGAQQHQQSDHEDNDDDDDSLIDHQTNDTNNNNNNQMDAETGNNNNNNSDLKSASTKTQGELMDIVEISRRRRLSKDSADSLTSFIRWSFVNLEQQQQQQSKHRSILVDTNDDTILDDASDRNWSSNNNNNNSIPNKQHSKLINESPNDVSLALLMAQELQQQRLQGRSIVQSDLLNGLQDRQLISGKRTRSQAYSPDNAIFNGPSNKRASYSGSVVERLHNNNNNNNNQHNQQQHLLQTAINQSQISDRILKAEQSDSNSKQSDNPGLSYHLQQFLQQQTSLDDNNLALAAALHRAIIDSTSGTGSSAANNAGNNGANQLAAADSKSTASSTGGSSSAVSSSSSNGGGGIDVTGNVNISANNNQIENSGANLNLVDSLIRQRRAYQTRAAAMHSLSSSSSAAAAAVASHRQHQQQQQQQSAAAAAAAAAALSLNSRIQQQQRYAQAAAALSALASSGSRSAISSQQQPQAPSAAAAAAAAAAIGLGVNNPMVDFVCETCNSSFDDRHRLMQHQSIHLELKKDWFTETPVDEVMKIFNRRRGEFLCNICNLRFEATLDYDQHNHAVHGPRPYCCQFCGNGTRTFKCWRQYLNHLYDHRYVFSCTIDDCDFTVNRRDSLRFHIFRFHLNCRLPQNQLNSHNHNNNINININKTMNLSKQSHIGAHNLSALGILDGRFRRDPDSRWQLNDRLVVDDPEDDADDTGSEMNVAD